MPTIEQSDINTEDLNQLGDALIQQGKLNKTGALYAALSVFFLALSTLIDQIDLLI